MKEVVLKGPTTVSGTRRLIIAALCSPRCTWDPRRATLEHTAYCIEYRGTDGQDFLTSLSDELRGKLTPPIRLFPHEEGKWRGHEATELVVEFECEPNGKLVTLWVTPAGPGRVCIEKLKGDYEVDFKGRSGPSKVLFSASKILSSAKELDLAGAVATPAVRVEVLPTRPLAETFDCEVDNVEYKGPKPADYHSGKKRERNSTWCRKKLVDYVGPLLLVEGTSAGLYFGVDDATKAAWGFPLAASFCLDDVGTLFEEYLREFRPALPSSLVVTLRLLDIVASPGRYVVECIIDWAQGALPFPRPVLHRRSALLGLTRAGDVKAVAWPGLWLRSHELGPKMRQLLTSGMVYKCLAAPHSAHYRLGLFEHHAEVAEGASSFVFEHHLEYRTHATWLIVATTSMLGKVKDFLSDSVHLLLVHTNDSDPATTGTQLREALNLKSRTIVDVVWIEHMEPLPLRGRAPVPRPPPTSFLDCLEEPLTRMAARWLGGAEEVPMALLHWVPQWDLHSRLCNEIRSCIGKDGEPACALVRVEQVYRRSGCTTLLRLAMAQLHADRVPVAFEPSAKQVLDRLGKGGPFTAVAFLDLGSTSHVKKLVKAASQYKGSPFVLVLGYPCEQDYLTAKAIHVDPFLPPTAVPDFCDRMAQLAPHAATVYQDLRQSSLGGHLLEYIVPAISPGAATVTDYVDQQVAIIQHDEPSVSALHLIAVLSLFGGRGATASELNMTPLTPLQPFRELLRAGSLVAVDVLADARDRSFYVWHPWLAFEVLYHKWGLFAVDGILEVAAFAFDEYGGRSLALLRYCFSYKSDGSFTFALANAWKEATPPGTQPCLENGGQKILDFFKEIPSRRKEKDMTHLIACLVAAKVFRRAGASVTALEAVAELLESVLAKSSKEQDAAARTHLVDSSLGELYVDCGKVSLGISHLETALEGAVDGKVRTRLRARIERARTRPPQASREEDGEAGRWRDVFRYGKRV